MSDPKQVTLASPPEMEACHKMVLDGEYDMPDVICRFEGAPVILDIGACCGFFSFWASQRWPGAKILAYEASEYNFKYLEENAPQIPNLEIFNLAVGSNESRLRLYAGKNNPGQRSFYPELGEQTRDYELAERVSPSDLDSCNILKCDTEGSECDIIMNYVNNACAPELIMFEYHGDGKRRELDRFLREREYLLSGGHVAGPHRGVMKYVRMT